MSKILIRSQQYFEVDLGSFHEPEIQSVIASKANAIYPGFFYAPFEVIINSEHGSNKADFVLVELEYRSWWVCEVELLNHSLYDHVIPQVKTFRDGKYDQRHVTYAVNKNQEIDPIRFGVLVETERPGILVVVNRFNKEWESVIRYEGAKLSVFEMFRQENRSEFAFRINGYIPQPQGEVLSYVEVDSGMPRLLKVLKPSALPGHNGDILQIAMKDVVSDWKINLYEDKAWLNPIGGHSLKTEIKYKLCRTLDGALIFKTER